MKNIPVPGRLLAALSVTVLLAGCTLTDTSPPASLVTPTDSVAPDAAGTSDGSATVTPGNPSPVTPAMSASPEAASTATPSAEPGGPVGACRKALDSLQAVDPGKAAKLKSQFTTLVTAATQYSNVRGQVNGTTRQAIDAMYQFQTLHLCAGIDQALMDSLASRGEGAMR